MNRNELTDYVFKFWKNWGYFEYGPLTEEELEEEIYTNLGNEDGIFEETNCVINELENGWDEDSVEHKDLMELLDNLKNYKSTFDKRKESENNE